MNEMDKLDVDSAEKCTILVRSVIQNLINVCKRKKGARPSFVSFKHCSRFAIVSIS